MTTQTIFYFSILVFSLMAIGIILTVLEFTRMRKDAERKGVKREG